MTIKHIFDGKDITNVLTDPHLAITFKGEPFSAEDLLKLMREYVIEEGWQGERGDGNIKTDFNFPETNYIQRVNPQLGRDIWWRWRFFKNPLNRNTFWRWHLFIDVHLIWIKQVEVNIKDKKVKAESGEVEVQLRAFLETDAAKQWEKSPWFKPLKKIWLTRIKKTQRDELFKQLRTEAYQLHDLVKNYFSMQTFRPEHAMEGFFPKKLPE